MSSTAAEEGDRQPSSGKKKKRQETKSERQRLKSKWLEGADGVSASSCIRQQLGDHQATGGSPHGVPRNAHAPCPGGSRLAVPPPFVVDDDEDDSGHEAASDMEEEMQDEEDQECGSSVGEWAPLSIHLGLPTCNGMRTLLDHFSATLSGFLVGGGGFTIASELGAQAIRHNG